MKTVKLFWSGPFDVDDLYNDECIGCKEDTYSNECMDLECDGCPIFQEKGVYQIYGSHPSNGPESLLYIGQTKRTFRERLLEEVESNNNWYGKTGGSISFYLARIDEDFQEDEIDIVEKLLITAHMPPCNSQHLTIKEGSKLHPENVIIWNYDYYNRLLPELSTDYYGIS